MVPHSTQQSHDLASFPTRRSERYGFATRRHIRHHRQTPNPYRPAPRRDRRPSPGWIDVAARLIHFPSSITKNKRPHTIPIGCSAAAIIDRVPELGDYLFPAPRDLTESPRQSSTVGASAKRSSTTCGVTSSWTLHDLRRTFATNLAALGVAPHITERLLNHATGTISGVAAIYNRHAYMDEMRAAIALWEERLASLLAQHAPANIPAA